MYPKFWILDMVGLKFKLDNLIGKTNNIRVNQHYYFPKKTNFPTKKNLRVPTSSKSLS